MRLLIARIAIAAGATLIWLAPVAAGKTFEPRESAITQNKMSQLQTALRNYITEYGRFPHADLKSMFAILGGEDRSTFRICPQCHRIWYSAIGKRYILKADIRDAFVFESQSGNLVVAEPIARRVIGGKWKNLVIQKLGLRDAPIDGLDIPVQT